MSQNDQPNQNDQPKKINPKDILLVLDFDNTIVNKHLHRCCSDILKGTKDSVTGEVIVEGREVTNQDVDKFIKDTGIKNPEKLIPLLKAALANGTEVHVASYTAYAREVKYVIDNHLGLSPEEAAKITVVGKFPKDLNQDLPRQKYQEHQKYFGKNFHICMLVEKYKKEHKGALPRKVLLIDDKDKNIERMGNFAASLSGQAQWLAEHSLEISDLEKIEFKGIRAEHNGKGISDYLEEAANLIGIDLGQEMATRDEAVTTENSAQEQGGDAPNLVKAVKLLFKEIAAQGKRGVDVKNLENAAKLITQEITAQGKQGGDVENLENAAVLITQEITAQGKQGRDVRNLAEAVKSLFKEITTPKQSRDANNIATVQAQNREVQANNVPQTAQQTNTISDEEAVNILKQEIKTMQSLFSQIFMTDKTKNEFVEDEVLRLVNDADKQLSSSAVCAEVSAIRTELEKFTLTDQDIRDRFGTDAFGNSIVLTDKHILQIREIYEGEIRANCPKNLDPDGLQKIKFDALASTGSHIDQILRDNVIQPSVPATSPQEGQQSRHVVNNHSTKPPLPPASAKPKLTPQGGQKSEPLYVSREEILAKKAQDRTARSNKDNNKQKVIINLKGRDPIYESVSLKQGSNDVVKKSSEEQKSDPIYGNLTASKQATPPPIPPRSPSPQGNQKSEHNANPTTPKAAVRQATLPPVPSRSPSPQEGQQSRHNAHFSSEMKNIIAQHGANLKQEPASNGHGNGGSNSMSNTPPPVPAKPKAAITGR